MFSLYHLLPARSAYRFAQASNVSITFIIVYFSWKGACPQTGWQPVQRRLPVLYGHRPFFAAAQRQPEHLESNFIVGKGSFGLGDLTQAQVERFYALVV